VSPHVTVGNSRDPPAKQGAAPGSRASGWGRAVWARRRTSPRFVRGA
jgi:hypothetical protein